MGELGKAIEAEEGGLVILAEPGGGALLTEITTRFELLARGGRGRWRKVVLVEIFGPWFLPGEQPGRFATHHFTTRPDDPEYEGILANQYFEPRIKSDSGPLVRRSLVNGNLLRGRSVPDGGSVVLINRDLALSYLSNALKGSQIKIRIASDGWYLSDARTIFTGLVEKIDSATDGKRKTLEYASLDRLVQKELQTRTYRGFGQAVLLDGSSGTRLLFASQEGFVSTTGHLGVEAYVKIFAVADQVLVSHGGYTSGNWTLLQNADGTVSFRVLSDLTGLPTTVTSDTELPAGWEGRVACRYEDGEIQVFIEGIPDGLPVAFAGPLQADELDMYIGSDVSSRWADIWITDIRVWTESRTDEQMYANRHRTLGADDAVGLALYAKTNEGGADTETWDDLNNYKGVLEGAAVFVSTKTGGLDLEGKYIPTSWGFVPHRDAVQVDGIDLIYQVHHRSIQSFDAVFAGGKKLIPLYSFVADDTTFFSPSADRHLIIIGTDLETPIANDFRPFVPGQVITVTGGPHPGDYTVLSVDDRDGRAIHVAETVANAITGDPVTFATKAGTHEFIPSESDGTFQLLAPSNKPITCRVRGDNVGGFVYTPADLIKRMATDMLGLSGAQIHTSFNDVAASHPFRAFYLTGTEKTEADKVFSDVAGSIGANWGATVDTNQLDLVVYRPPDPDATGDDLFELSEFEILKLNRLRSVQPVKRTIVRYRPNARQMTWDELVLEVQEDQSSRGQEHRQYLLSEGLLESYTPPPTQQLGDAPNALAESVDELFSYLVDKAAAAQVAYEQWLLYGVEREIFAPEVKLQPYLYDHRRVTVLLTHGNYDSTVLGKRCRIVSMEGYRTKSKIEVWG